MMKKKHILMKIKTHKKHFADLKEHHYKNAHGLSKNHALAGRTSLLILNEFRHDKGGR